MAKTMYDGAAGIMELEKRIEGLERRVLIERKGK
jgi:hypothetical protein